MIETKLMSIGGYAFTMDSLASQAASDYIASLESFYLSKEGGKEIMEGIEERMAELLLEKTSQGSVVSKAMVEEVIEIIGKPEVIEEESAGPSAGNKNAEESSEKKDNPRKKLYRDLSEKVVGGVCSGLAIYTGIDVVLFRLAFVVFQVLLMVGCVQKSPVFVTPAALYVILWISMPAAKTVKQKWSQKGESGSLDDIQRNVMSPKKTREKPLGHGFARGLEVFIGILFLIISVSGIVAGSVGSFFPGSFGIDNLYLGFIQELKTVPGVVSVLEMPLVKFLGVLAWFLPFIGILYAGIMMIFGFKAPSWHPGLVIFVLWLIVIVILITLIVASYLQYGIILDV